MKTSRFFLVVLAILFGFSQAGFCLDVDELDAPDYPSNLTAKSWYKARKSKRGVKTGMGPALIECKEKFDAIDWDKLQAKGWLSLKNPRTAWVAGKMAGTEALGKAHNYHKSKVEPLRNELKKLKREARDTLKDLEEQLSQPKVKNKRQIKRLVAYLPKVINEAKSYRKALDWGEAGHVVYPYVETFMQYQAYYEDVKEGMMVAFVNGKGRMKAALPDFKSAGDEADNQLWTKKFKQPTRTVHAFYQRLPKKPGNCMAETNELQSLAESQSGQELVETVKKIYKLTKQCSKMLKKIY